MIVWDDTSLDPLDDPEIVIPRAEHPGGADEVPSRWLWISAATMAAGLLVVGAGVALAAASSWLSGPLYILGVAFFAASFYSERRFVDDGR